MVRLAGRPTLQTLLVMAVVFALQATGSLVGLGTVAFALSLPLDVRPWTLVSATYSHAGVGHLLANAVALVLVGPLVGRRTTPLRFHAFFLTVGALAGVAELLAAAAVGAGVAVVGASGAVFGLVGYALAGNRLARPLFDRLGLGRTATLVVFAGLAVVLTLTTAAPGLALVAHFSGLLLGLLAGRVGLLRTG
jgi:membrane associated rhomboid family serine protease